MEPELLDGRPGHRPLGRAVQDRVGLGPTTITLVQNPKWWGTPANARSITVHIASSTEQLAQWMASGYVQVAEPATVTPAFLTQMTGLPGAQSDVDTSATLLQLDMASSLDSDLSPDLRAGIALSINRQDLVNQQVSWAVPGIAVADSHVYVQGQQDYKPVSTGAPTTTIPPPTSSTSTTVDRGRRERELPGDAGARPGGRLHRGVGAGPHAGRPRTTTPPSAHRSSCTWCTTSSDPWAATAGPVIRAELEAAGLDTTLDAGRRRRPGRAGAGRRVRRPGAAPGDVHAVHEPDDLVVHDAARAAGQERIARTGPNYSNSQFDQLVETASQQLNPNTAAGDYAQADTQLWDEMVSLPLFAEPAALAWSRPSGA